MRYDNNLFFTCSLIEFIGRGQKLRRGDVVNAMGDKALRRVYEYADVLHCEPIAKVGDEYVRLCGIPTGDFDNMARCKYTVPDYWDIGSVYQRLIQDVTEGDALETLKKIYGSWISDRISDYNSDFFYQPREYIRECWLEGKVL